MTICHRIRKIQVELQSIDFSLRDRLLVEHRLFNYSIFIDDNRNAMSHAYSCNQNLGSKQILSS